MPPRSHDSTAIAPELSGSMPRNTTFEGVGAPAAAAAAAVRAVAGGVEGRVLLLASSSLW